MKENDKKIAVVPSAEALEHLHWDYRFVAQPIVVINKSDTVDRDTGEVITLDTIGTVLFEKGHELSQNDISALLFHFQVGDIEEIYLSSEQRRGTVVGKGWKLWTVKAKGQNKIKLMLKANSALLAYEVAKDYIELNYKGMFVIESIKTFADSVIIEPEEKEDNTHTSVDRCWYKLVVEIFNEDTDDTYGEHNFVVYAENADAAKQTINNHLAMDWAKRGINDLMVVRTKTAQPIRYDLVVPNDFCQAYNEYKEEE